MKDDENSFYIYQIEKNKFCCCGLFAATSVADYRNNVIKKHEDTIQRREKNFFANYLNTVEISMQKPVLMTYSNRSSISKIIETAKKNEHPNTISPLPIK